MNSVTLCEAQQNLIKLVHGLEQRGEVIITDNNRPIARLTPLKVTTPKVSLRDLKPASVGAVLQQFPSKDDDLLGELLETQ